MIKAFIKPLKPYTGIFCFVLGVVAYLIAFVWSEAGTTRYDIAMQAGNVLLSGGVLGLLLTMAHSMGIFRRDLEKVLYGEEFLSKGTDLEGIWMSVSKKLCAREFPGIRDKLFKTIREYFPTDKCYYENYERDTIIIWESEPDGKVIVTQTITFTLKAENKSAFTHEIRVWTPVSDELRYNTTMGEISVDDEIVNVEEKINRNLGDKGGVERVYEVPLKGKNQYKVIYRRRASYYLEDDCCEGLDAAYMIKNLNVSLTLPPELKAFFVNHGTLKGFESMRTNGNNMMKRRSKGIVLPHQGYVFVITRRHNNNQNGN